MAKQIKTDSRLIFLLESGRMFLDAIDPDGILDNPSSTELRINRHQGTWSIRLAFDKGLLLNISGTIKDNVPEISKFDNGREEYAIMPEKRPKTAVEALDDLSRIPTWLKVYLSKEIRTGGNNGIGVEVVKKLMAIATDANFYNVEGGNAEKLREAFGNWTFKYILSENDETIRTQISAEYYGAGKTTISVSVETDIYGIGNKKVILSKQLGMGHYALVSCIKKDKDKNRPSIMVAFDLDKVIPELYSPSQPKKSAKIEKNKPVKS